MFKTKEDGTRQIHLRVSAEKHKQLKVKAALSDQSINEMLAAKVCSILEDELDASGKTNKKG